LQVYSVPEFKRTQRINGQYWNTFNQEQPATALLSPTKSILVSKSYKKPKHYFTDEDFEPDHVYEARKRREERKKKADAALYELMLKEGFGG
jgi:hypothetical protein